MIMSEIPLFSGMNEEEIKKITEISNLVYFKADEFVFQEGDEFRGMYVVLKGMVKVFKISPQGKEYILHLLAKPQIFGDVPLFTGEQCPVNVRALQDTTLMFIPGTEFLELLEGNPKLSLKVIAGFARRLQSITAKAGDLSLKEVINRLAGYLVSELENINKAPLSEPAIKLKVSNPTLAAYLGTIPETTSRAFKKLKENNIIKKTQGKTILVKDIIELRKIAAG